MTREQIKRILETEPKAVHAGIVRIHANQTEDEKSSRTTRESNGRGFNYRDADFGSYLAEWVKAGKTLTGKFLVSARKMCIFYAKQLVEESEARREANTVYLTSGSLTEMDPFGGAIWFTVDRSDVA